MNIPEKIDEILAKRKVLLPQLESALERVQRARQAVEGLEAFRSAQDSNMPPELMEKLASIPTRPFYEKYGASVRLLEHLQRRFSREEINISFVGRAGQGKSLVLQRISGLEGDVIPSADGSDCTGARSVISNRPGMETQAEITFYSEQEFVGIVNRYLKEIFKTDTYCIGSVAEISRLNMAELKGKIRYDQVTETSLLTHLEKYVEHAQELQRRLGTRVTIPKNEIESYVAQYNSRDPSQKYYTYLGVKGANILSAFPCEQCGKIVLVDTIGTGATSLGVEEEMIGTVREDSDAVILMMRPDPLRPRVASEDYQLVEKISAAVSPEYAKQMLFWLINRVETGKAPNAERVPDIMRQLKGQDLPVAQYLNVNCWEQKEVEEGLLLPVLEQLSGHLADIDRMILERANVQLAELEQAYHLISSRIDRAMGASVNQDERRAFERRIDRLIASTTNELRDLYLRMDKEKNTPCATLKEAAAIKLKNVLHSVPKKEEILQLLNDGTIHQHNALEVLTNRLRLQIINDFLELNTALHEAVRNMKHEVIGILADEEKGTLGAMAGTETGNPDAWLHALRDKLDEVQFPLLRAALEPLEVFDLRMENFLIYKVRCCLSKIDWSLMKQPPQLYNGIDAKEELADEIDEQLRDLLERVHSGIKDELEDYYVFPNTAMYAVIRDFYDRAVYAYTEDGKTAETEWRYLYEDMIPIIWAEEHKQYSASAGRAEEWHILTDAVHDCAADGYFRIELGKRGA